MIPITRVQFGPEEERLVLEVLRSGSIAQGPKVKELEDEFGAMFGLGNVVAVNNGTTALVAALQVLLYAGTLGRKHDPTLLTDLARALPDARVVVVAEGAGLLRVPLAGQ